MLPANRIGQRDIALRAGVHITTVSLALRDSPRLPEATRRRIQALAQEMGYSPDPMLAALTVYRSQVRKIHHQGTLAWVLPVVRKGQPWGGFSDYRRGAAARCAELGYALEEFRLSELGRHRLSKVLRARNIQGLLLPPQAFNRAHIQFDWENFSAVCFGFTLARPRLHLVTNAQYRSTRIAVRALRALGYRRIGFVTTASVDERTDQNFSSGFSSEQRRFRAQDQVPSLILKDSTGVKESGELLAWYRQHRPEAILFFHPTVEEYIAKIGLSPQECAWASLTLSKPDGSTAGICQNDLLIGKSAVDFLIGMIHRNERGIPECRQQLLIEGTWIDGKTAPPKQGARGGSEPVL